MCITMRRCFLADFEETNPIGFTKKVFLTSPITLPATTLPATTLPATTLSATTLSATALPTTTN